MAKNFQRKSTYFASGASLAGRYILRLKTCIQEFKYYSVNKRLSDEICVKYNMIVNNLYAR